VAKRIGSKTDSPRGRGGDIVFPSIERYLEGLDGNRGSVLREMEDLAAATDFPIVGPLVGRTLELLARSIGARRVVELGSGFGYSALWFARALSEEGELILTDGSARQSQQAREFLGRAGVRCRVRYEVGDALEALGRIAGEFDIVFNDIDKERYPAVFLEAVPRVRVGGYFLSDNMLWGGRVVGDRTLASTRGVVELTRLLYSAPHLCTAILPIRDGLSVSLRLS